MFDHVSSDHSRSDVRIAINMRCELAALLTNLKCSTAASRATEPIRNRDMTRYRKLLIGLSAACLLALLLAFWRPFAYRAIEFTDPALVATSLTHRPAPGVVTWYAVPKTYGMQTTRYSVRLFRGRERFPRIFINVVGVNGALLRVRGSNIRGAQSPFFYDWAAGDSETLKIVVLDAVGRPIGRHEFAFHVPVRGPYVEHDGL
jgi:hypothetical protein